LAARFAAAGGPVAATADWHSPGHVSFASSHPGKKPNDTIDLPDLPGQILWPDHCLRGSPGAEFHPALDLNPVNIIIRKGFRPELDSYSAFFENDHRHSTGLDGFFRSLTVDTVVLGGLAADYCVLYSALDAAALGYRTFVLTDAVRGVGFPKGSVEQAFKKMKKAGITLLESGAIE
jgi:nicotinamidase/pyrazinamidase